MPNKSLSRSAALRRHLATAITKVAAFALLACVLQAQTTQPAAFEAASIRLVEAHTVEDLAKGIGLTSISPWGSNRFIARNITLSNLISIAYGVDSDKLSGKPGWLDGQEYDVSAKAEGDTGLTKEQMQPLLRQLLEQRFHLATHTEKKEVQGYALVEAKGGAKLKASNGEGEPHFQVLSQGFSGHHGTLEVLAKLLAFPTGRPVVNKTGIQGAYDFDLKYAPLADPNSDLPSVFTALQEQLGLKLESQKVPVEILVIDHVDKVPTEN